MYLIDISLKDISVKNMSELATIALTALIATSSGMLGSYAMLKLGVRNIKKQVEPILEQVMPIAIDGLEQYLNTPEGKQFFYSIGVLIGNGAGAGIGLKPAGNNPKNLMGLVMQLAPELIKGFLNKGQSSEGQSSNTQTW